MTHSTKRWLRFVALGSVLLCLAGCGDTPGVLFRESIICRSELADGLSKIKNDRQAERFLETNYVLLKQRWDSIKNRTGRLFEAEKEKEKQKLAEDYLAYLDEDLEAEQRLRLELSRLILLRASLYADYKQQWEESDPEDRGQLETADKMYPSLTKILREIPGKFMPDQIWRQNPFLQNMPKRPSLEQGTSNPGGPGGPPPGGPGGPPPGGPGGPPPGP